MSRRNGDDSDLAGDVLGDKLEREWFADDAARQAENARRIEELAAKGLALAKAMAALKGRGTDAGASHQVVSALRGLYRTPWQMALQKWLESVAPGERTFVRPSAARRRTRSDVVLPGRKRESWMLNVLLDTSGSMTSEIPRALGAIAEFCDAMAVDCIRVVQCDVEITADAIVTPDELATFQVSGFGGSDLSPAMLALADDPRVTAAVIVTDGDIAYPREAMPYQRALGAARARQLCSALWRGGQHGGRAAMKAVQELVSYFDRRGKLSERQIRKLLDGGYLAADAPVNMVDLCRRHRRDLLFPGARQDRGAALGHRHLCRRFRAGGRRRACRPGQARRDRVHQGDDGRSR